MAVQSAIVEAINIASKRGAPAYAVDVAILDPQAGLHEDRHAGSGVVSLIEIEAVDTFNSETGMAVAPGEMRRNIVTRGVRLNPLVGKRFYVGDVLMEGTELCDPCASLGRRLATAEVTAPEVVKRLLVSAGIRARVLSAGEIRPGTPIQLCY